MRTEHDLRDAFTLLARAADAHSEASPAPDAPHGDVVTLDTVPRHAPTERTRRRWSAPTAVAASVALILGAAATVVALSGSNDGSGRTQHAGAAASPQLSASTSASARTLSFHDLVFRVTAPGLRTSGTLLSASEQIAYLVGTSASYAVRVYADRAEPVYVSQGAVPVQVNGHRGYYAQLTPDTGGSQRGVAWQYAPGAWASVARTDATITSAQGVQLAQAVQVGTAMPARTPVAVTAIPGVRTDLWLTGYGIDPSRQGQHGYAGWDALYNFNVGDALLTVSADDIPGSIDTSGDATTIHGHSAYVTFSDTTHLVSIDWNGHAVNVQEPVDGVTGGYHLTRAQLLEIAAGVTLVDRPANPATWFDAKDALPAS